MMSEIERGGPPSTEHGLTPLNQGRESYQPLTVNSYTGNLVGPS